MLKVQQAVPRGQAAIQKRTKLPYDPLEPQCPTCKAYSGQPCVSSRGRRIRHPHVRRVELAAALYRSEIRRRILDRTRRGPFAIAFSPRRLSQADCFQVRRPR